MCCTKGGGGGELLTRSPIVAQKSRHNNDILTLFIEKAVDPYTRRELGVVVLQYNCNI